MWNIFTDTPKALFHIIKTLLYIPIEKIKFAQLRLIKFLGAIFPNIDIPKITIDESELIRLSSMTGFRPDQIRHLWSRFDYLSGPRNYITSLDLINVPELAMNPLSQRIVQVLLRDDKKANTLLSSKQKTTRKRRSSAMGRLLTGGDVSEGRLDFEEFAKRLSVFSDSPCRREKKLEFAFRIYDLKEDGVIDEEEIMYILKLMVGDAFEPRMLRQMSDETMISVNLDRDGKISFHEFSKAMKNVDINAHLHLVF